MEEGKMAFRKVITALIILALLLGVAVLPAHAQTFFEDFESGVGNWTTEGTWSLIATDSHSSENCMTDSPDGNYPNNAYSALVSPPISLSGSSNLILSFWHHYSFYKAGYPYESRNDDGRVQISTDDGLTWTELRKFTGTMNTWKYELIDVSAYSGQTVRIRFVLLSKGGHEADGWSVDDVSVEGEELPVSQPSYTEDFENGTGNWTTEGTWGLIDSDSHSPTHCMTDSPDGNYPDNAYSALVSPPISLSDSSNLTLSYWHHYSFYKAGYPYQSRNDEGWVQISTDDGLTWTNLITHTGTVSTWHQRFLDLSAYGGQTVRIRFALYSKGGHEADGWSVDDVSVEGEELPIGQSLYTEDFGNGAVDWIMEGTWSLISSDYHSPDHCMTDSTDANYPNNADTSLMSPSINLPNANPLHLTYWHHYSFYKAGYPYQSRNDDGRVEISTNGGLTWTNLITHTGTVSTWHRRSLDLSAYGGQVVKIRFRLTSRGGYEADGWYVDDVSIDASGTRCSVEICDGIDNDCDGEVDEGLTQQTTCGVGECAGNTGQETCDAGSWGSDTCDPLAGATPEACDNLDNDCDGSTDEDLTQQTTCGVGECAVNTGQETCEAGSWVDDTCDPLAGAKPEACDNLDNDCDGSTDEDLIQQTVMSYNS